MLYGMTNRQRAARKGRERRFIATSGELDALGFRNAPDGERFQNTGENFDEG
jgi:hypothetical protein